jgi:hypothetical protein
MLGCEYYAAPRLYMRVILTLYDLFRIKQHSANIVTFEIGIISEDFAVGHPRGKKFQNGFRRIAQATNDRLPMANLRVYCNAGKKPISALHIIHNIAALHVVRITPFTSAIRMRCRWR